MLSPEEEFAMTRGEHGHPESEGYGHTRLEGWETRRGRHPAGGPATPETAGPSGDREP